MKTVQEVQKNLSLIGLGPNQKSFNLVISRILVLSLLGVISLYMFLFLEADSAQDYMKSVFITTTSVGILLSIASTVFTKQKIFSFMEGSDEIVNGCKLNFNLQNMEKSTMHMNISLKHKKFRFDEPKIESNL